MSIVEKPAIRRRKRHQRANIRPPFEITRLDITSILANIARFRFLTSDQIIRIDPRHPRTVYDRTRGLYDHGYIERLGTIEGRIYRDMNAPVTYAIANPGWSLLQKNMAAIAAFQRRLDWWTKNAKVKNAHVEHTLKVADMVMHFQSAAAAHGLTIYDHYDVLDIMPEATVKRKYPFKLTAEIEGKTLSVTPDRLIVARSPENLRLNLTPEWDTGEYSMPIERHSFIAGTSIIRKIATYNAAYNENTASEQWGFRQWFVPFITSTPARRDEMIAKQKKYLDGKGSRLFLFTDRDTFFGSDPFSAIWINGRGETHALLPASVPQLSSTVSR